MIKKILTSKIAYRLNKRFPILDVFEWYKKDHTDAKIWLIKTLSFFKANSKGYKPKGVLLIQMVKDYEYMIKMAAASKVYVEKHHLKICFYNPYWMKWIGLLDKIEVIYLKCFKSSVLKMYQSFGEKLIFDAEEKYADQLKVKKEKDRIQTSLNKPNDILEIEIDGIKVGDLIYDTYLRFYNVPTVETVKDERLDLIIEITLNIFYSFTETLNKQPIKCLFTTFTSYIGHGVVARICLERGIPVFAFGLYNDIILKVDKDTPIHAIKHWEFSPEKIIPESKLETAKINFTSRFAGELDAAISYMRKSPFLNTPLDEVLRKDFELNKRNVII